MSPTKSIEHKLMVEVLNSDIPDFPNLEFCFGTLPRFCATQMDCAIQLIAWRKNAAGLNADYVLNGVARIHLLHL